MELILPRKAPSKVYLASLASAVAMLEGWEYTHGSVAMSDEKPGIGMVGGGVRRVDKVVENPAELTCRVHITYILRIRTYLRRDQ